MIISREGNFVGAQPRDATLRATHPRVSEGTIVIMAAAVVNSFKTQLLSSRLSRSDLTAQRGIFLGRTANVGRPDGSNEVLVGGYGYTFSNGGEMIVANYLLCKSM